jgi:hypothetical protein
MTVPPGVRQSASSRCLESRKLSTRSARCLEPKHTCESSWMLRRFVLVG